MMSRVVVGSLGYLFVPRTAWCGMLRRGIRFA
jgi:hypothetical protein